MLRGIRYQIITIKSHYGLSEHKTVLGGNTPTQGKPSLWLPPELTAEGSLQPGGLLKISGRQSHPWAGRECLRGSSLCWFRIDSVTGVCSGVKAAPPIAVTIALVQLAISKVCGSQGTDASVGGGEVWGEGHWGKDQTTFRPLQEPEALHLAAFPDLHWEVCSTLGLRHLHSKCDW